MAGFKKTAIAMVLGFCITEGSAHAGGTLDFLDPCIKAEQEFHKASDQIFADYDLEMAATPNETAPADYRQAVWAGLKETLRAEFDKDPYTKILQNYGIDLDGAFKDWYPMVIEEAGGEQAVNAEIDTVYREEKTKALKDARAATATQVAAQKKELDSSCKSDVANQSLRVAINAILTPANIVAGNLEGAKRENGVFNKVVRASIGVSIKDIRKDGIMGGPNSEARKIEREVRNAGKWFKDRLGIHI